MAVNEPGEPSKSMVREDATTRRGWCVRHLDELYEFGSGLSKPRSEFGSGLPFLTFKDVFYNTFLPEELGDLVNSTERERKACDIRRGDVFLTRTSETMEELGMSSVALRDYPDATFNGFTKRLRPRPEAAVLPEYAAYYFRSGRFRRAVTAMSSLSTRASLNNEMLSRLSITLPPLHTQQSIGRVLKAFDDKIELNRRTNETLEAMARAIFKSWFVDFDPVRSKADLSSGALAKGEGRQPHLPAVASAKAGGIPAHIADLIPDSFQDSPLGPIPKGWSIESIGEVVDCVGGATPSTKDARYWDGGTNCFATPKDLSGLKFPVLLDTERHVTQAGVDKISSGLLPKGTVLLSSRAPIGYLSIAEVPVCVNQGFVAMKCNARVPNLFVLRWAEANMDAIKANANGSTFLEISKRNLRPIPITLPTKEVMAAFMDMVRPLHDLMVSNERESRTLASTRDTLLPKLLTGEVSVSVKSGVPE